MTYYLRQKQESQALEFFDQLAKEQPESGLNHYYRGRLLVRLRQFDVAEQAYQEVTELSPGQPEGYRSLAELYLKTNRRLAEAKTLVQKVVELQPSARISSCWPRRVPKTKISMEPVRQWGGPWRWTPTTPTTASSTSGSRRGSSTE